MATGADVLKFLRPNGGWVITGDDFDSIRLDDGIEPISKKEFVDGFALADAAKEKAIADNEAKRSAALAKLQALGLNEDDLKAIGL